MNINLEALGITKEAVVRAVLEETGLTAEGAVKALAKELGVEVINADDYQPEASALSNGAEVLTTEGAARAAILSDGEIATLREAAAIQTRLFS